MQIRFLALCSMLDFFFNIVRSGYVCEDIKIKKRGCIKIRYTLFSYPLVKETYNKTKP